MKILITGSNGLLGQKLVSLLKQDSSVELYATARGEDRTLHKNNYNYHSLDITNKDEVLRIFHLVKPDVVIHTAAMTNVDTCEQDHAACDIQNVTATEHVVKASAEVKAFLLHVSTDFIFDGSHGPLDENESPNPVNYYGLSKLKAEQIVQSYPYHWAIARTVLVYGIVEGMSRSNIVLWVKGSLEQGKSIQVVDDQFRTPTLAEDLAMGCILIAKQKAQGIFNISGEEGLTPYEMAIQVADYWNLDKSLIKKADSSTFTQPAKRPPITGFIIDKAKKILGYQPHSFKEGIKVLASQL
jgi:dTDP-4-dehydrorhamnose reductase